MGGGGTKPNTTLSPPELSNVLRLRPYSVQLQQFDFEDSNTFSACWCFHNPLNSGLQDLLHVYVQSFSHDARVCRY